MVDIWRETGGDEVYVFRNNGRRRMVYNLPTPIWAPSCDRAPRLRGRVSRHAFACRKRFVINGSATKTRVRRRRGLLESRRDLPWWAR